MDDINLVVEKMRGEIGKERWVNTYAIENGTIQSFNRAVGDDNPLWNNAEYARECGYEDIIASPPLLVALGWDDHEQQFFNYRPYNSGVHGSTEVEFLEPVMPGDVITVNCRMTDVYHHKGKAFGDMIFFVFERIYTNQKQQVVAKCVQTQINFQGEELKHV